VSEEPVVTLVEMTSPEIAEWLPGALERFIAARIDAGESPARASSMASSQRETSFPGGTPARGHHVLGVVVNGEQAGALWIGAGFSPEKPRARSLLLRAR
jgi:hypothetical protein